jgi:HEPN domain-containing protein
MRRLKMKENARKLAEGWFEKSRNQLEAAKGHLKSRVRWSEAVEAAQESIELSVKSLLSLLRVRFPPSHGWTNESLGGIAEQIRARDLLSKLKSHGLYWSPRLPRLLLITNLWARFYIPAKYGIEQGGLAIPQELFEQKEAELAVEHTEECYRAASEVRYLSRDKLDALRHE